MIEGEKRVWPLTLTNTFPEPPKPEPPNPHSKSAPLSTYSMLHSTGYDKAELRPWPIKLTNLDVNNLEGGRGGGFPMACEVRKNQLESGKRVSLMDQMLLCPLENTQQANPASKL